MGRITSYSEKTSPGSNDYLLLDSSSDGTKKILASNIVTIDPAPAKGSTNAVSSGGVWGIENAVEGFVSEEKQMVKRAFIGDHSYNALTVIANADTLTINGQSTQNNEAFLLDTNKNIAQHCGGFNANFFSIYNPQHIKNIENGHLYTLKFELLSGSITRGGVTYTSFADVGSASVVRAFLIKSDATAESYSQGKYYLMRAITGSVSNVLTVNSIGALALFIYPNTTLNNAVIRINLADETAKESDFVDIFNATEVGKEFQIVEEKVEQFESDYYTSIIHSVSEWDAGGISTSGGNTSTEEQLLGRRRNRIRLTLEESQKENDMSITVKNGYWAQLYEYDDTGGSWNPSTFKQIKFTWFEGTKLFTVPSVTGYRVAIRKSDESNFDGTEDLTDAVIFKTIRTSGTYDSQNIIKRNDVVRTELKLQQLKRPTRIGLRELATPPFCLIHFSDVHGDATCLKNVVDYYNHYKSYIDDVIHTGDTVTTTSENGTEFWVDTEGAEKILNVIGNHDTRVITDGVTDWTALDMSESYDTYFAPYIENWGAIYESGKTYYYKDYTAKKIRLIVLDIMHQTSEQLAWFVSTLASAKTAGLHVICACHSRAHWQFTSYNTTWDDKVHSPEYSGGYSYGDTSGYSGTNYPSNLSNNYANAVDDFIDAGGNFVCWLHGHTHYKIFAVLTAHPNQLNIAVANNSRPQYAWTYVWARISGTKSEDDFNVVAVDTYSKVLRIMKVGVDYDRYMRHTDVISYDYGNHNILYSV